MDVNYFGCVAVTKALLSYIPDDGAIVIVNSVQGRISVPYRCAYSASKHAIQVIISSFFTFSLFLVTIEKSDYFCHQ